MKTFIVWSDKWNFILFYIYFIFYRRKINTPTATGADVIPTPPANNSLTDDDGVPSITIHESSGKTHRTAVGYEQLQVDNYYNS